MNTFSANRFIVKGRKILIGGLVTTAAGTHLEYRCPETLAIRSTTEYEDTYDRAYQDKVKNEQAFQSFQTRVQSEWDEADKAQSTVKHDVYITNERPRKVVSETIVKDVHGNMRIIKHYA